MAGSENKSPLGQNARIGAGHAEWSDNGCGPPPAPKAKRSTVAHGMLYAHPVYTEEKGATQMTGPDLRTEHAPEHVLYAVRKLRS